MGKIREDLDGGLTDGPDPVWLKPGQLSYIQNATYEPNSSALKRAKGRTTFGTATAASSTVNGIRDANFDNSAGHYLIAQISGAVPAYVTAMVGATGAFGILASSITAGSTLEVLQHNNRFFLLNGATAREDESNTNLVLYLTATGTANTLFIRPHGLLPVKTPPIVTTAVSAFAITDAGASGYYEYWTTEVEKIVQDGVTIEIESTYGVPGTATAAGAAVATAFVSDVTVVAPVITMPAQVNPQATHWRIYRSPKKVFSTDVKFPSGFSIGTFSITGSATATINPQTIVDAIASGSGNYVFPTAANSSAALEPNAYYLTASAAFVADGNHASGSANDTVVARRHFGPKDVSQLYYGFNFGGFRGFIQGITVEMKCFISATQYSYHQLGRSVEVRLGRRDPGTGKIPANSPARAAVVSALASPGQVITFGGNADKWTQPGGLNFVDTDFDGNLGALISSPLGHIGVDYIKIKPNYGLGTLASGGAPFPTVIYTFGDISAQVGKNGMPPSADTGDIFEDCLVTNDKLNPSIIRYSAPGLPEYFPATYFLDFETTQNDVVTFIKVVNNRLVVGLSTSVWRANYLPTERDASFDRGKAIEPLTRSYGCINPMCVCVFSRDNSTEMLAWVSQKGIHITDGFSFDTMTTDLEWRNILSLTSTSQAISLINDPENLMLKFLYRNDALAEPYKELQLSYRGRKSDSSQTENLTQLTIAGQVAMRNVTATPGAATANPASMWAVPMDNGDTSIYIGYGSSTAAGGGQVYIESGSTIPAADPVMGFKTRRMFLAGEGKEVEIHTVYGHIGSNAATAGIDMKALNIKTNDDAGQVTVASNTIAFGGRKLGKWQLRAMTEGLVLSAAVTGTPNQDLSWDYLLVEGDDFGEEDSGK